MSRWHRSWLQPTRGATSLSSAPSIICLTCSPAKRWRLTVRLQRPHGNANPGGFDYEAWLLEQGVRATGYVRATRATAARTISCHARHLVERSRARCAPHPAALPGKPYAGVIVALVIGDQRGIDQSDWQVFNRTGIGHLVSSPGLHITMVAGWRRWRRQPVAALLLHRRAAAAAAAGAKGGGAGGARPALLYVLLAGFGVPAQRTLYMLAVVALALWTGRLIQRVARAVRGARRGRAARSLGRAVAGLLAVVRGGGA
jgi:competence protein ComEC